MKNLSAQRIKELLDSDLDVYVYDEVTSTNDVAKGISQGAVFALRQTAGRGRSMGRKFYSGEGGLYFSLALGIKDGLLNINAAPFSPGRLTISAGIAVTKVLIGLRYNALVKWVNDVYVDGKKVCGILAEGAGDKAVLGIGVNLASQIPDELSEKAASLNFTADFCEVAAAIINTLIREISSPDIEFLNTHCLTLGKRVKTLSGEGIAVGVDGTGALLVDINGNICRVFSGEAEILL